MQTKQLINASLKVLGVAGLAGLTVVAPNAIQGLAPLLKKGGVKTSNYSRLLSDLKRQGLIHIAQSDDEYTYTLTPAGMYRLQEVLIDEVEIPKPKQWDQRWRLVAFDVPVKNSRKRQKFVEKLQGLNFYMVQKSLWVHPFSCFEQIEQLAGHYNVWRYCMLAEVQMLDEQTTRRLLKHFESLIT